MSCDKCGHAECRCGPGAAQGPEYYDAVYDRTVAGEEPLAEEWAAERTAEIAPLLTGSVLDLGCGLGEIADHAPGRYFGIDFSERALRHARARCRNLRATFAWGDLRALARVAKDIGEFDTVLMLEVLEHVDDPRDAAAIAEACARRRIVATVPRDMPGRAHVKPSWTGEELAELVGPGTECRLFGGEAGDRWWLAVREVGG